ncbi:MAG TPA: NAD-dependent epimerase/dehydratase family protein [Candidatus Limnocylindrales bacterium]|jgi:nucleoside-diphosphate-sugar epimerase|nr:NAD-dependent epimerase/dehydratase family protein [Candidatus Limnocylindrales bacterium]
MLVLVTGATGFLGRWIVRALAEAGHEARVLARDRARAERALGGGADIQVGDPMRPDDVLAALGGCDRLVHAAAVYSYERRDAARMVEENPRLARTVLAAAREADVERVVDVSSAVVFRLGASRVDESSPIAGPGDRGWDDPYLQSKALAERVGQDLDEAGLRRVTIHPTSVLGPEDSGPGTSGGVVVSLLRGGSSADGRLGWVDVRDVAAAAVAALDAPTGRRYLVTPGVRTLADVADRLDALTGRHPRRLFVPPRIVRLLARLNDLAAGRLAPLPPAPALEYVLDCPPVIDGALAERELGIRYRDLDETLADAIRWWAANGVIPVELAGRLA